MTRCQDIMKRDLECLSPRESASEAARRMRDRNVGFLPVISLSDIAKLDSGRAAATTLRRISERESRAETRL